MTPYTDTPTRRRLKPAGHSATIEALIQPAIVVGSTLMSAIAAYVLALDEITQLLADRGTPSDVFIVVLCAGMGFLIDMAIIVSATRYKMHAVRADLRERRWLTLAKWVLGIGLLSESMTLFYFFVHLSASAFPGPLVNLADLIHSALAISRAFLPPVVIAYFAAGVLPVAFDRADRNREIKSRTSSNIMLLIDRLSEVFDTDDKAEMLRALGGQLMLDTYATYDETGRTSEDQQLQRDAKLLLHLARIHRLDWSAIAADVAPELATPTPVASHQAALAGAGMPPSAHLAIGAPAYFEASQQPHTATQEGAGDVAPTMPDKSDAPTRPPTGPGSPASKPARQTSKAAAANVTPLRSSRAPRQTRRVAARANARSGKRGTAEARVRALLAEEPTIEFADLVTRADVSESTASKWLAVVAAERAAAGTAGQRAQ